MLRDEKLIDQLVGAIYRKFRSPKNQEKGESWKIMSDAELLLHLAEERNELIESVDHGDFRNAIEEAADHTTEESEGQTRTAYRMWDSELDAIADGK